MEHIAELETAMAALRKAASQLPREDSIFSKKLLEQAAGIEQYIVRHKMRDQLKFKRVS